MGSGMYANKDGSFRAPESSFRGTTKYQHTDDGWMEALPWPDVAYCIRIQYSICGVELAGQFSLRQISKLLVRLTDRQSSLHSADSSSLRWPR